MSNLNKVMIIGRLGKDPEVKYTQAGQAVASMSVATSEKWKDKNGEQQERTEWHRVVAWGKLAELCGEYLKKGSLAYFEGKIQTREYEKDGSKRYSTEVVAQTVQFLTKKEGDAKPAKSDYTFGPPPVSEDDIPF